MSAANRRPSFFDGISEEDMEQILRGLERRHFPAGTTILAEGDTMTEIYVVQSGSAELVVTDREGMEHRRGRVRTGSTLGEVSIFTGEPASNTVRAIEDMEVLVLSEHDFERAAARHPSIYRNLGAILAERLSRTDRALKGAPGELAILRDWSAPPLLGYALACSVAWHTRTPTLLLVLGTSPHEDLRKLAFRIGDSAPWAARVVLSPTIDHLRQVSVAGRVEELFTSYQNILVQVPRGEPLPPLQTARVVNLADAPASIPAEERGPRVVIGWSLAAGRTGPDPAGAVFVPAPTEADEEAMQRGDLSTDSPTGQALGLAARDLAGLKVGVALGGGSNRGYAHMGVLRVLERAGVTVDYLSGTSIGSAVGAGYALGLSPDEITATFDRIGAVAFRPTIPVRSLLSSRSLARLIASTCGSARLEHLSLPFAVVAADLETRREVVLRRGRVWRAVMASMAIPGIYPAVRMGGYTLVDGGVLNPVPASAVTAMGADVVIAVKLGPAPAEPDLDGLAAESSGKPPSALAVLLRSLELMQSLISREPGDAKTIQITPNFPVMSARLRNFSAGRAYIEAGERAAEAALPRIAAALPWLRD